MLLALVAFTALRFTLCSDSYQRETINEDSRLIGKSMAVTRQDYLFDSPYDWGKLQKQDGYLAYVKDGCVQVITGKKPLSYVDEMIAYWDANGGKEVEKFYADWEAKNK